MHTDASGDRHTPAESAVTWYARHGFDLVVITDHNVIAPPPANPANLVFPGVEVTQDYSTCVPPEGDTPCRIHVNALFVDADARSITPSC